MHVRGVPGEEDASLSVALGETDVGPEHRRPPDVAQGDVPVAGGRADPFVEACLVEHGFLVGRQPDHPLEQLAVGQGAGADEPALETGPHVPAVTGQARGDRVHDEHAVLFVRRPGEADADLSADGARTAVGADDIAGGDLLDAVGTRHLGGDEVGVLPQFDEFRRELGTVTELFEPVVQCAVGAVLGDQPGVGVRDVRARLPVGHHSPRGGQGAEMDPEQRIGAAAREDGVEGSEVLQHLQTAGLDALGP